MGMQNPFAFNNPVGILSKDDLIQAIRTDINSEFEAQLLYDAHANASDDPLVKAVLQSIRDEEKAHVGELLSLLNYLDPEGTKHFESGKGEVKDKMRELGMLGSARPGNANDRVVREIN